ncbi:hypothetical protein [Ralstonia phage RSK1]|uniref:Uncharacterized protein n=2 Tax=Firingavirus TaxID=2843381 RepID=U6C6Z4_9CAUD|nr:hypothetical protein X532_gp18 [Ralstonia phage RSK1]BAO04683.1 hypothetical protein [Ralstonia phage RSK1]
MVMTTIDPVEFGRVLARLDEQDKAMNEMRTDLKNLLAMANQGKGSLWVLTSMGAMVGAVLTAAAQHMWFGK